MSLHKIKKLSDFFEGHDRMTYSILFDKDKRTYFLILYIIDQSYQKFWEKNFFNGRPIIISYIPQIFNDKCLINQKEISSEIENSIQEQKRKENIILKIKVEKIYLLLIIKEIFWEIIIKPKPILKNLKKIIVKKEK